jgi:hypothetical protein
MHALQTFLATLIVGLATRVASLEEVCGREVSTVGQCRQENSQVCYDGDGSILCTCDDAVCDFEHT